MRHLLIAENSKDAVGFINTLCDTGCITLTGTVANNLHSYQWDVILPHGRYDQIRYMRHDHDAPWAHNVGNIFRASNSFCTDESYYYVMRKIIWQHDPFTAHWAKFTKDTFINFSPQPEAEIYKLCMESINAKTIRRHRP